MEYWARNKPFAPDVATAQYPLDFFEPWILTKENVGDPKTYVTQTPDVRAFMAAKWEAEFGL